MAVARWLETDTNTNKDISSAVSIGAYTADADRMIVCDVSVDQAAGNGDYVIYVTRQINGAGSAYVLLPKTTCAAASGETAIAMQSGPVTVRSGDVLTVYLDGLAGDTTTSDITVRWFEMATLRPATADRQLTVAATGEASANVTLWKDQTAPDAPPSKAELDALETHGDATWATADVSALATAAALATVDGIVDAIKLKTDLISADGSVSVTAAISGSTITILRGDSLSVAIAGLGDISTRSKLWFTAKQDTGDADTSAIIQLEETDGLVRLNGAAGTAVLGEITVTDEDAGDITITLDETATDDLTPRRNMSYDVQVLTATGTVTTLTSGTLHVTADVTRAVA